MPNVIRTYVRKIYKLDNIIIIDDAELNILRQLCHVIDEMFGCVILHC